MGKRIKYTDEPLGAPRVVEDFLPAPENLAFKEVNVKVAIALSKSSVDYFKSAARKKRRHYEKMT
ncbi:MAG: CopG family transcriptional regulator [Planctomycetota bacterium]